MAALQRFASYDIQSNVGEELGKRQITKEAGDLMDELEETSSSKLPVLHKLISAYADNKFFELNLPNDGLFFKIKSNNGTRYVTATGASNDEWQLQTTEDANDEVRFSACPIITSSPLPPAVPCI